MRTADDALKPWQHQSWIFSCDPHFAVKASRVLDLYQREWEGQPLSEDEYVLSADEKPGVQARMRIHLPFPPGPGRAMRAESEYHRFGTLTYLAAYDVHRAQVIGRCEPSTGIKPFTALVDQVMQAEPYASARQVFWVVDNGASHRNWATGGPGLGRYARCHASRDERSTRSALPSPPEAVFTIQAYGSEPLYDPDQCANSPSRTQEPAGRRVARRPGRRSFTSQVNLPPDHPARARARTIAGHLAATSNQPLHDTASGDRDA